jgi:hypothetical protein
MESKGFGPEVTARGGQLEMLALDSEALRD